MSRERRPRPAAAAPGRPAAAGHLRFGREKRLLVGMLALLAPLPLPFNDVVGWPVLAAYAAAVILFLRRARRDPPRWLPVWGMNVLGLAYLPLGALDLLVINRGHLVGPVVHLGLYALVCKLFALTRERDKWQAVLGIFFIFLAAMGTSVHPTIVIYLGAFLALSLILLMRLTYFHVLGDFGRDDPALARVPMRWLLASTSGVALLLAVPLFALLPRVRTPFIVGRGTGTGAVLEASGFSDAVSLDSIDQIRLSHKVVLRIRHEGPGAPREEMRFKAATYDLYRGGSWQRTPPHGTLDRRPGGRFQLSPVAPAGWISVTLQPLRSRSLPLPVEAVVVEPRMSTLEIDQGGAVSFGISPLEVRDYRVGLAVRPVLLGMVPGPQPDPTLDLSGVTPRIAALAKLAMGQGVPLDQARRLERHLSSSYGYTLDFAGRSADNPIEDFLFRYKSGECEYFASAMVLMLRSQGVPARLVTGFLGGEFNLFEGDFVLRDSNAHAWVEAYAEPAGWQIFDPTPPAGRPLQSSRGVWLLANQAWDFVSFRWDRYVLTYGLYDQLQVFNWLQARWHSLLGLFHRHGAEARAWRSVPGGAGATSAAGAASGRGAAVAALSPWWLAAGAAGLLALAALAWLLVRRLRRPATATAAYRRLRRQLARSGLPLPPSAAPLAVGAQAASRFPAAAPAAARVIDFYLRESFGGERLAPPDLAAVDAALAAAAEGLRLRRAS
ncbi:MAG TPA: DUF3488 and transglutaminase-like domain-containing protein [Thermoanaerobaculia bacterium]|nr:DUF3488 and transglutaminase-like domain-containing protein [Thermoanaerobaculia bacterium]